MTTSNIQTIYSSQSVDLRASNSYLTNLSFPLDDYCVITAEMPGGMIVPLHSHGDRESFYVLSGEVNLYYSDGWRALKPRDFVDVNSNAKHAWHNTSKVAASMLVITTVRMGIFLRRVSSPVMTRLASNTNIDQQENFFKLVRDYGYWLGSPEDNQAIGLSNDWHNR